MRTDFLPLITVEDQAAMAARDELLFTIGCYAERDHELEEELEQFGVLHLITQAVALEPVPVNIQNADNERLMPRTNMTSHQAEARYYRYLNATKEAGTLQPNKLALDAIVSEFYLTSDTTAPDASYAAALEYAKLFPENEHVARLLANSAKGFAKLRDVERLMDIANQPTLEPQERRKVLNLIIGLPVDRRDSAQTQIATEAFEEQLQYYKVFKSFSNSEKAAEFSSELECFVDAAISGRILGYSEIKKIIDNAKLYYAKRHDGLSKIDVIEQKLVAACIAYNLPSVYGNSEEVVPHIKSKAVLNTYINSLLATAERDDSETPAYKQAIEFLVGFAERKQINFDAVLGHINVPSAWAQDYKSKIVADIAAAADMAAWERFSKVLPKLTARYATYENDILRRELFTGLLQHGHTSEAISLIESLRRYGHTVSELVFEVAEVLIGAQDRQQLDILLAHGYVTVATRKAVQRLLLDSQPQQEASLIAQLQDNVLQPEVRLDHGLNALLEKDVTEISSEQLLTLWRMVIESKSRSTTKIANKMVQLAFKRDDVELLLAAAPHMGKAAQTELLSVAGLHSAVWTAKLLEIVHKPIATAYRKTLATYTISLATSEEK